MSKPSFAIPRGMKDIDREEMAKRLWVEDRILEVLRTYGFQLVEPSPIESLETLEAKCGPAIKDEIYWFEDKAGRKQGLRFDLTVGLSRMVATDTFLPMPLKVCALSNMWRYDEPQFGRYRCFYQWDAEIFGSPEVEADGEAISLSIDTLKNLGLSTVSARINSRKLIEGFLKLNGINTQTQLESALRTIDKFRKLPEKELRAEFEKIGISKVTTERILELASIQGPPEKVLAEIPLNVKNHESAAKGLEDLNRLVDILGAFGKLGQCLYDMSIVRGIGYYDGIVFEVYENKDSQIGAVVGGGRFDGLCKTFGRDIPATGAAGGIERIILALEKAGVLPNLNQAPKVFVATVDDSVLAEAWKIVGQLRSAGISADFDLKKRSLSRQLEFANTLGVSFTIILGPRELQKRTAKLRDMRSRREKEVELTKIADEIKKGQ